MSDKMDDSGLIRYNHDTGDWEAKRDSDEEWKVVTDRISRGMCEESYISDKRLYNIIYEGK